MANAKHRYTLTLLGERREIDAADDSEAERIACDAIRATGHNPTLSPMGWISAGDDYYRTLFRWTDSAPRPTYCGVIRREKI